MITIKEEKNFNKANTLFDKLSVSSKPNSGSSVEFTKKLNNRVLGVIKENSLYTIKIAEKKSGKLIAEDFQYINGYEDRKRFQRKTLQEAIKYLHLYLNEDQYVLDVPVPNQPAPSPTPAPEMPPMDNPQDAPLDGEMPTEDGMAPEGGDSPSNDNQQEMQKLTGTLAQDLRQEIQGGDENFTVGMFKSILAAAKELSPENKEKVMNKAEEVLGAEEQQSEPQPTDATAAPNTNNQEQQPVQEMKKIQESKSKTAEFFELTQKVNPLRKVDDPKEVLKKLEEKFGNLPNCIDYRTLVDKKHCGIRFMTTGDYDLFVFYFATVEVGNYEVFVVHQSKVRQFYDLIGDFQYAEMEKDKALKKNSIIRNSILDVNFDDVLLPVTQFLTDPKKPFSGNLSVSSKGIKDNESEINESFFTTKKQLFESLKKKINEDEFEDDDDMNDNKPIQMHQETRPFNKINWREVYETLVHNQQTIETPKRGVIALNTGDFEDEHLLNQSELRLLEELGITAIEQNAFPVFSGDIVSFDDFYKEVKSMWDDYLNGDFEFHSDNDAENERKFFGGHG